MSEIQFVRLRLPSQGGFEMLLILGREGNSTVYLAVDVVPVFRVTSVIVLDTQIGVCSSTVQDDV